MPPLSSSSSSSRRSKAKAAAASPSLSVSRSPTPKPNDRTAATAAVVRAAAVSASSTPTPPLLFLSVEELQQTPDNRLLSYLMECYNAVRGVALRPLLSTTASPSLSVAAAAAASAGRRDTNPFTAAFVEELLTPRLLFSAIPDVSQLVACLLCDAVRLHHQQQQQQRRRVEGESDSQDWTPNTSGSTVAPSSPGRLLASQQSAEDDVAAGVAPLPFASTRCADVLRCIARVFAELHPPTLASPFSPAASLPLKRVAYLVERAAVAHVFRYLLPHCPLATAETQSALQCLFDAVRCASVNSSGGVSTASAASLSAEGRAGGSGASAATCGEMAQILIDVLAATGDITAAQLTPLLEELAGATAALRHASKTSWTAVGGGNGRGSPSRPAQLQGGALITARVLLEQTEVALQPAIAAWATGEFDEGVEELLAAEVLEGDGDGDGAAADGMSDVDSNSGGEGSNAEPPPQQRRPTRDSASLGKGSEPQLSRRRNGLRKVARVLEVLVALTELSVDLVDQVLPALAPHLEHPNADLRLLLVRGFGAIFAAHDAAVAVYAAVFTGPFLNRFADVKPNIRLEALRVSTTLLTQCAVRSSSGGRYAAAKHDSCVAQQSRLWAAFQPCWDRLLTDAHVLVRKQAVSAVTEAALAAPLLFEQQPTHNTPGTRHGDRNGAAGESPSPQLLLLTPPSVFLAQTLGLRGRDKNKRVRDAAVEGLTKLFHAYRLTWIPNVVLDAVRVEAGGAAAGRGNTATSASPPTPAEVVVEKLLLATADAAGRSTTSSLGAGRAAGGASGHQPTLTRWMGSASTTAARTAGGRPNPALFDFEQADNNNNNENSHIDGAPRVKAEQAGNDGGSSAETHWDEGDALLGLQPSSSGRNSGSFANPRLSSGSGAASSATTVTFVDSLLHLCQSVDAVHFAQLLRLSEKKPQLRKAIDKLFEFHAAMKASNADVKSAEGQQRINAIHRLLQFLQDTTGSNKGEWDALFRAKDDTVRKALLRACHADHMDWVDVRTVLLRSLQGRVAANVFAFVQNVLAPQLFLPTQPEHVQELLRRLHRSIYVSGRAEVVVDTPEAVAVLRALLLITAAAPAYSCCTGAGLAEALQAAVKQSAGPPPAWCALLLHALQQWATATASSSGAGGAATAQHGAALTAEQRRDVVQALQSMATAALPMQQVVVKADTAKKSLRSVSSPQACPSPLTTLKQLAKQATRTVLALLQVPGLEQEAAAALQALASRLTQQLANGRALTNDVKTVAWLASVQALSAHPRGAAALRAVGDAAAVPPPAKPEARESKEVASVPALLPHLRVLLLAAVADVSDVAEHAKLAKPQSAAAAAAAAASTASASGGSETEVSVPLSAAPATLASTVSVAAAIVDGAAKAITRLALSCPTANATRAAAVSHAMESLLQAYKAAAGLTCGRAGPASIGSCQRRLAVEKQLVKLLATPTADLAKEMAAAVVLSVEEEAQVREVVQHKLAALLLQRACDMRVAALLLLTAISEDTKSSYQRLRSLVESVGDHLRGKQASQGVSLSSPAALYCYWEYTVPFLVLFLAHHPYYASEETETQFLAFQRVWHLLVGELFRHGTQCAGFVVELLSKLKQSDDALDPTTNATRVMCDLGSRVLLACLGQRQSRAEDLRRYPGAILVPSFFVKTAQASPQKLLETVYLSDGVRVAPNAPFRLSAATAVAGGSRGSSRPATPRASSLVVDVEDVAPAGEESEPSPRQRHAQRTPSTQRKRRRSPSAEVGESPSVSFSPSVPPVLTPTHVEVDSDAAEEDTASSSSSQQRARTEPALADSSETPASAHVSADRNTRAECSVDASEVWREEEEEEGFDSGVKREEVQKDAVNGALKALFTGLTKTQIAQLRWKVVRGRLEEALHSAEAAFDARQPKKLDQRFAMHASTTATVTESNLEALLQYAKDQLRVWYNDAPA